MKKATVLALSIVGLAGTAIANPETDIDRGPYGYRVVSGGHPVGYPPARPLNEVVQTVYDNTSRLFAAANAGNAATLATNGSLHSLEDLIFTPGPWTNPSTGTGGRIATEMDICATARGLAGVINPVQFDIVLFFWDGAVDFSNTTNVLTPCTPIDLDGGDANPHTPFRFAVTGATAGFVTIYTAINLTGLPGGGISFSGDRGAVEINLVRPGQDARLLASFMRTTSPLGAGGADIIVPNPTANPAGQVATGDIVGPFYGVALAPGATQSAYGRDVNMNLTFQGAAANGGGLTERRSIAGAGAAAGQFFSYGIKLRGDANPPTPPTPIVEDLGLLDCNASGGGTITRTVDIAPASIGFYRIEIPGSATPGLNTFMDITASDPSLTVNTTLVVYNEVGGFPSEFADDTDSGPLVDAQLTFGQGRRAPVGDGTDFDGRSGDMLTAADGGVSGVFFIGVTGNGASFGEGFSRDVSAVADVGQATLTISHNLSATGNCALPTIVPPTEDVIQLGEIAPGVVTSASTGNVGLGTIQWWKFSLPASLEVVPGNGRYVDMDDLGSSEVANPAIFLYDNTGNLVTLDNDSGPGAFDQISFGDPNVARPAVGNGLPYQGQDGDTLLAGEYYVAIGLLDLNFEVTGWQVRSTSGSSLPVQLNIRTPLPFSCARDYNGADGINGDDLADFIADFFDSISIQPGFASPIAIPGGFAGNGTLAYPGFGVACPEAADVPQPNPWGAPIDAYRTGGFKNGVNQNNPTGCGVGGPISGPNGDDLADYISIFFNGCP